MGRLQGKARMMRLLERGQIPSAPANNVRKRVLARNPLGRYGDPAEVASMMGFLDSDESAFCTGGVYTVYGGLSASLGPASAQMVACCDSLGL